MENITGYLSVRKQLVGDLHRPKYHFLPPSNWMNDPNGLIQWQGKVHLFYQHNPHGALWGDMHWGHASSPDLIHWTDLPIAMTPTPGGPDEAGVFSGCAVNNAGTPTLFYTGTRGQHNEIQTQCMATGSDDLLTWQKYPGNPIISQIPPEAGQTRDFRDPFVWKEGDTWFMVLGSKIQGVGGAIFLYRSTNLIDWEYLHPLLVGDIKRNGVIWECPNFFKLDDSWVLIISSHLGNATGTAIYFVGSYENNHFVPEYEGVFDYGVLYAPLSFVDQNNRRILIGWLREARSDKDQLRAGWSGVQSIPRLLSLDGEKRLTSVPVPEVERLRGVHHHYGPLDVPEPVTLDVSGLALDIVAEFAPISGGNGGLSVACSPDHQERTDILYDPANGELSIRHVSPTIAEARQERVVTVPHRLTNGEALKLRVLFDGSVLEIIANDRTSVTARTYPSHADNTRVLITGSATHLNSLDIWEMRSIWP